MTRRTSRWAMATRRIVVALVIVGATTSSAVLTADPAAADAAGPTDFATEVVAIEPADDRLAVEIIGGDSFVQLDVEAGSDVVVIGYQGEPYLWFRSDGTISENTRSPSTWQNAERYGTADIPGFANAEAEPQWREIATSTSWAWHDHRAHWMNDVDPPGAQPGDQILEGVVPLIVNGENVRITVASFLLDPPAQWPRIIGALIGLAGAAAVLTRQRSLQALVIVVVACSAGLFGWVAFGSVPAETAPSMRLWVLPLIAAGAAAGIALLHKRLTTTVYLDGFSVAAGVSLAVWGAQRLDAVTSALIPSNAPADLDRVIIVTAFVVGVALAIRGLYGLLRPQRINHGV